MEKTQMDVKKICCLYVSDWHLSVMLVQYINKQINKDVGITTIFKKDVKKNIEKLVEISGLKNNEKIMSIDYGKKEVISYDDIEKMMDSVIQNKELNIIIDLEEEEQLKVNTYIEKYIEKKCIINKKIKIIYCFEILSSKNNLDKIIKKYNSVLNTTGEILVEKFF